MKTPKQRYPSYVAQPLIPLSPHNNEIRAEESEGDREALDCTKRKYVPRRVGRQDLPWEMRVWNAIHVPVSRFKWVREVDKNTGERIYRLKTLDIAVRCIASGSGIRFRSPTPNETSFAVYVSEGASEDLVIISGVVRDAIKHQSSVGKR